MFTFQLHDVPRIKEIWALAKVCGCDRCPTCIQWHMVSKSLSLPKNVYVLKEVLDIPQEVFHNRGS